jgi:hypothetical protein
VCAGTVKKAEGVVAEHTSMLDTVYNLGLLYADQRKIVEAEQMCVCGRSDDTRRT